LQNTDVDITSGVKTFFVTPDLSVFPEEGLKHFFLHGYESYFLHDDPYCPLASKIHLLFSLFPELILFFNVDRRVQGISWPHFLATLQATYGDRARIGVMYQKRNDEGEKRRLEKLFLYDMGLVSGCVPLEYKRNRNQDMFVDILSANQANGKRRNIRILCGDRHKMNIRARGKEFQAVLRDISISHFSCVFPGGDPDIPLHQKVCDIQLNLHGVLCRIDAVMCLKRMSGEELIHVFVFRDRNDREGLNPDTQERVNGIIFNTMQSCVGDHLRRVFAAERARLMNPGPSFVAASSVLPAPEAPCSAPRGGTPEAPLPDVDKLLATI
jgi:hypothetical protein